MGQRRKPTSEAYGELQQAYDFYNKRLYNSQLPGCLITFQRKGRRTYGYYSPSRWKSGRVITDEIALNPEHYKDGKREVTELLSTLVHEMVHLKQRHFGKPGTRGYHNKEFARFMKEVGLYPSNTGAEGGKETGYQMTHYIVRGGPFDVATRKLLLGGFTISWHDVHARPIQKGDPQPLSPPEKKPTRQKFSCPKCHLNAWAKYEAPLVCGKCDRKMKPVGIL